MKLELSIEFLIFLDAPVYLPRWLSFSLFYYTTNSIKYTVQPQNTGLQIEDKRARKLNQKAQMKFKSDLSRTLTLIVEQRDSKTIWSLKKKKIVWY